MNRDPKHEHWPPEPLGDQATACRPPERGRGWLRTDSPSFASSRLDRRFLSRIGPRDDLSKSGGTIEYRGEWLELAFLSGFRERLRSHLRSSCHAHTGRRAHRDPLYAIPHTRMLIRGVRRRMLGKSDPSQTNKGALGSACGTALAL